MSNDPSVLQLNEKLFEKFRSSAVQESKKGILLAAIELWEDCLESGPSQADDARLDGSILTVLGTVIPILTHERGDIPDLNTVYGLRHGPIKLRKALKFFSEAVNIDLGNLLRLVPFEVGPGKMRGPNQFEIEVWRASNAFMFEHAAWEINPRLGWAPASAPYGVSLGPIPRGSAEEQEPRLRRIMEYLYGRKRNWSEAGKHAYRTEIEYLDEHLTWSEEHPLYPRT